MDKTGVTPVVWVTGAAGMLGTEVVAALTGCGIEVKATDREVDIADPDAVEACARATIRAGGWIVNCAAWTAVDEAETREAEARRLNALGPALLAAAALRRKARLLHVSTDYVFDGAGSRPYRPDDPPRPQNAYGRTKAEGEAVVQQTLPEHIIVRTAWLYGARGSNFVFTMLRLMRERESLGVVADQRGAPTAAFDLAAAIAAMTSHPTPSFGTWHYTNTGETTWYGFAQAIRALARRRGLLTRDCAIRPLTSAEYPRPAKRPAYSVLDTETLRRDWSITPPDWRVSLERFINSLDATSPG